MSKQPHYNITRKYHFYAAHRNEALIGTKCERVHGHTYDIEVFLEFGGTGIAGVTIPFESIDAIIEPFIKAYDHGMLINNADPLYAFIEHAPAEITNAFKFIVFDKEPTSIENLAKRLYYQLKDTSLAPYLNMVKVQETASAFCVYAEYEKSEKY